MRVILLMSCSCSQGTMHTGDGVRSEDRLPPTAMFTRAVQGLDSRTPPQELLSAFVHLFSGAFAGEVVLFTGVFRQVEEFVGPVSVVVDVLLENLDARQALVLVKAADHEGTLAG